MEKNCEQRPGQRRLSRLEQHFLSKAARDYLLSNPGVYCLQPDTFPADALYLTFSHGAVTLERAMELDALYARRALAMSSAPPRRPLPVMEVSDEWERRDLRCSDEHGCSTVLW